MGAAAMGALALTAEPNPLLRFRALTSPRTPALRWGCSVTTAARLLAMEVRTDPEAPAPTVRPNPSLRFRASTWSPTPVPRPGCSATTAARLLVQAAGVVPDRAGAVAPALTRQ